MKWPTDAQGQYLSPQGAAEYVRINGTPKRPSPPRNLQQQPGSRKALVTWDAPLVAEGIIGYKIYKDTEISLLDTLRDPNVRQYNVALTAGATPPTANVFVSSFSQNSESVKVLIQCKATAEAGAPADPKPPAGSSASGDTGKTFGFDGSDSGDAGFTVR